jgi:hypothetical protein
VTDEQQPASDEDSAEDRQEQPPEDRPDEPGAEGGSESPAADQLPTLPSRDDSELGDTDQHSTG